MARIYSGRMHVAMVTDYYLPTLGGVQTAIKSAKESLTALGHQVTVFCPLAAPSADPGVCGLPTSRFFRPDGFPFAWPPRAAITLLIEEFSARGVDVVHVHSEGFATLAGITAAQALGLPLVQTMHGRIDVYSTNVLPVPAVSTLLLAALHARQVSHDALPLHPDERYMKTAVARRMWRMMVNQANAADVVIVPSAHFAAKLIHQGVKPPVNVVSNALEESVIDSIASSKPSTFAGAPGLKLMWCGRVSPEKRPDVFVRAVAAAGDGVTGSIYGDGVASARIRRLIASLGVGHRVKMFGAVSQDDVLQAMLAHHGFVSSSYDFDNQPMVILEAVACGLPVILSDPDLAERLPTDGFRVAASAGAEDLAATFRLLVRDPALLASMREALSASLSEKQRNPNINSAVEKLLASYRQAIDVHAAK